MVVLYREPIQRFTQLPTLLDAVIAGRLLETPLARKNTVNAAFSGNSHGIAGALLKSLQNAPMGKTRSQLAEDSGYSKTKVIRAIEDMTKRGLVQRTSQPVNGRMTYFYALAQLAEVFRFTACYVQRQCACGKWRRLVHLPNGDWYMWCPCGTVKRYSQQEVGR